MTAKHFLSFLFGLCLIYNCGAQKNPETYMFIAYPSIFAGEDEMIDYDRIMSYAPKLCTEGFSVLWAGPN